MLTAPLSAELSRWVIVPLLLVLFAGELVQIGVFARGADGDELGAPLYARMHRIRTGEQTITVTVPREPVLAGVDPYHLLDIVELEQDNNIEEVQLER